MTVARYPSTAVSPSFALTAKTADYTVLSTDTGTGFTTIGAGGAVTFTLPTAVSGQIFGPFYVGAAQTLQILAPASHTITMGGVTTSAAGNVSSNTLGDSTYIIATGTNSYAAVNYTGSWNPSV